MKEFIFLVNHNTRFKGFIRAENIRAARVKAKKINKYYTVQGVGFCDTQGRKQIK